MTPTTKFEIVFNLIVRKYLVWWWYGLAAIELVAIWLRYKGYRVNLVSMEARDIVFNGLPTMAYFMGGMMAHWCITWNRLPWDDNTARVLGVLFWAVGVAYLLADIFDPRAQYWPTITQWLRYPPVVAAVGTILALICFPQRSLWYPGKL